MSQRWSLYFAEKKSGYNQSCFKRPSSGKVKIGLFIQWSLNAKLWKIRCVNIQCSLFCPHSTKAKAFNVVHY